MQWNKKNNPWFLEMEKQLSFGKTKISNNDCNKGGAANADTKGWRCQNKFGNISGNACGNDATCERHMNAFWQNLFNSTGGAFEGGTP